MAAKKNSKRQYGRAASKTVKKVMHEQKRGRLKSGRSKKTVKSRKQAVAIALSEARAAGAKVPSKRSSGSKESSRKSKTRARKKS